MQQLRKCLAGCALLAALAKSSPVPIVLAQNATSEPILFAEVGSSVNWISNGRGKGACPGHAVQGSPAVEVDGSGGITLQSNDAGHNSCIWRTSKSPINLKTVSRIEADVKTSGSNPEGQWFSFWLDPAHYVQPPKTSGEVDLIESFRVKNGVSTNFAGCDYGGNCQQKHWGVASNAVNHHITAKYDKRSSRLEVYHCAYGSHTCPSMNNAPFIMLNKFHLGDPNFYLVADIWNTVPGEHFTFSVKNIKLLSSLSEANQTAVDEIIV